MRVIGKRWFEESTFCSPAERLNHLELFEEAFGLIGWRGGLVE